MKNCNSTIVVADDEVHVLNSVQLFLRRSSWKVYTYSNPDQVLALLQHQNNATCLLTDWNFIGWKTQGIDLVQCCHMLGLPVAVMTSMPAASVNTALALIGVNNCLIIQKPVTRDKITSWLLEFTP